MSEFSAVAGGALDYSTKTMLTATYSSLMRP